MSSKPIERMRSDLLGMGRTKGTVNEYTRHAQRFLDFAGDGELDHHTVLDFLTQMGEGSPSTRRVAFFSIRNLFESMDKPLKLKRPKDPVVRNEVKRPVTDKARIQTMIEWAKNEGTPIERAYLAVATTYGLRRVELCGIHPGDIDEGHLMVFTRKGGQPRRHIIPPEIAPVIYGFDGWGRLGDYEMSQLFKTIAFQSLLDPLRGYGWHSIRRSLVTELFREGREGVDILTVHSFMRWQGGMSSMMSMPAVYTRFEAGEVDEKVFQIHPFLPFWRKDAYNEELDVLDIGSGNRLSASA